MKQTNSSIAHVISIKVVKTSQLLHCNMIKYDCFVILTNIGSNACNVCLHATGDEVIILVGVFWLVPAVVVDNDIIPN